MTSGKLLRQLIRTATDGNQTAFKSVVEEVINEERQRQHHLLANDLERILYGIEKKQSLSTKTWSAEIPKDNERGLPLINISEPVRSFEEIILSPENTHIISRILLEYNRKDLLSSYGLRPINKILFYGKPGTGKTLAAEVIARELEFPLVTVRLDSVVSSFLGETSANLGKVFNFISSGSFVVLFDEFDGLAKERALDSEHGELKRVVNAFLQLIDSYKGDSILIAATNHEKLLDSAIWRRFDEAMLLQCPTQPQIKKFLELKLSGVRRDYDESDKDIPLLFEGISFADIERVLIRAIKTMILNGKEFITKSDLEEANSIEKNRFIKS
jgi:SpoVK/Ycf46/Vps4 family AAA+-type ATPase